MTDRIDETDPEQERVRALLALTGTQERLPDDVAARLDARLAMLHEERTATTDRPDRSGRRPVWVLAAAGVAVIVAIGVPVVNRLTDTSTSRAPAAGAPTRSPAASGEESASSGAESAAPAPGTRQGRAARPSQSGSHLVSLTSTNFAGDVRRSLHALAARPGLRSLGSPSVPCRTFARKSGGGVNLVVLLDGHPAVLEELPAHDGTRTVRALSCTDAKTLASTRVPAP